MSAFAYRKPSAAIVVALLIAPPIMAAQWQTVASQSGSTVAIDASRLSRLKSGKVAAWTRLALERPVLDFENRVRYTVVQALNHYDCAGGSFVTQRRIYLLDDREIKSERVAAPRAVVVQPGSLDAQVLEAVCGARNVAELEQAAERAARAAHGAPHAQEGRARPMHAELVSASEALPARSVKVADAPIAPVAPAAEKPRLFEVPVIDKSKAEDPFKGAPPLPAPVSPAIPQPPRQPPTATAPAPAASSALPIARPQPSPTLAQEPSRQQRELMLATTGPRRAPAKKPPAEPPLLLPDYSKVEWGYAGLGAPENWAKLRPDYALCASGKRQSPIDIRGGIRVDLEPIRFDYRLTHFRIVDTGRTIRVDVGEGSSITVMGRVWPLDHIVFRRPSEERIDGRGFEMSAQLVHRDYDGSTAIVAIPMERGSEHPLIQAIWNHMPLEVGMEVTPERTAIDLNRLLPERREYFTYMGSLTTPPCTENVLWMVFKQPIQVSPEQIAIFARLYPNNARPVQPTNDRLIKGSR